MGNKTLVAIQFVLSISRKLKKKLYTIDMAKSELTNFAAFGTKCTASRLTSNFMEDALTDSAAAKAIESHLG